MDDLLSLSPSLVYHLKTGKLSEADMLLLFRETTPEMLPFVRYHIIPEEIPEEDHEKVLGYLKEGHKGYIHYILGLCSTKGRMRETYPFAFKHLSIARDHGMPCDDALKRVRELMIQEEKENPIIVRNWIPGTLRDPIMCMLVETMKRSDTHQGYVKLILISDMSMETFLAQSTETSLCEVCKVVDTYEPEEPGDYILLDELKTILKSRVPGYDPIFGMAVANPETRHF